MPLKHGKRMWKNPSSTSNSITLDTIIIRMILIFAFLLSFGDIKASLLFENDYLVYGNIWVSSQVYIYKEEKFSGMENRNTQ